jgi:hypothetical protein
MANSSFRKNQPIPFPVSQGGTGVTSLSYGGVLVGAGTGNVTTVAPGTAGNVLKSDGTSWTSGTTTLSDGSITYSKLATDFTQIVAMAANDVDWSLGAIYTKTLTGNTTLTFSNYKLNKSIILNITGNYTLSLPTTVKNISGTYNGNVINYIFLHCTKATVPQEVWATINQRVITGYGYFAGGSTGARVATTDRITFSTSVTSANTVSNLSQARYALAGISDILTYGYFAGGMTGAIVATADRIVFSTGATAASTVSNLSVARQNLAGVSDGINYGYFLGGETTSVVSTADRIVFSTGATLANTVSNLSIAKRLISGLSEVSAYGYFSGGLTDTGGTSYSATTDRITFSTGATAANTVSNLSQARYGLTGLSDNAIYGYFAGGSNAGLVATADRITFSTGVTSANTVSNLSSARRYVTSSSDGYIYGYFAGGESVSTAERIVFSTGATSANTASNLSQARGQASGLSDCSV